MDSGPQTKHLDHYVPAHWTGSAKPLFLACYCFHQIRTGAFPHGVNSNAPFYISIKQIYSVPLKSKVVKEGKERDSKE